MVLEFDPQRVEAVQLVESEVTWLCIFKFSVTRRKLFLVFTVVNFLRFTTVYILCE